jgi:crotonobetaine/carnitine-CoA ligase
MHWLKLENPEERVLGRILRRQGEEIPDRPYLMSGDDRYTYGQVNQLANWYAAGLAKLGLGKGETLAFLMKGCKEFVFSTFGAMKLGAIWVPTNVDYKGEWLRNGLLDSRARVLVVDAMLLPRVADVWNGLPFEHVIVHGEGDTDALKGKVALHDIRELGDSDAGEPADADINFGDTAAVLWTSGTTGRAKGVMQSHNAWTRGAESGARTSGTKEGEVMYCCLPMHNSAAWVACVYRALVTGLPFGLDPEFSASRFWDRCRHYGATQIFTLGAMHMFLWQAPEKPDDADNPVRHASMIPLPDELIHPIKKRFGIQTLDQGYGQSEVMGLVHRVDDGRTWKPRCLGAPLPGIEFRLLDDDDREVPTGEVGEFCVRPTQPFVLFSGYFNDPDATVRAWRNLWYHTGDLGRRDKDGDYFFVDRKADYIRYKGRSVSSFAIEAAVGAHPAVAECAAHGVTSAELESEAEIKVVAVLKPGQQLSAEALARFVNDNAPYFFVPRYIEFVDELPHTPTGRVQKFRLRERSVTKETWDRDKAGFVVER